MGTEDKFDGDGVVQYFENDRYVGERQHYFCGASDSGESFSAYWPHVAYFCPHCGKIWGRAINQYKFDYQPKVIPPWFVETRRCVEHGDGSFLVGADLDACSPELLRREAQLLLLRS